MTHKDPTTLFKTLNKFNVDFVIIGGHAVNYHGFIRTTEDFDIVITPTTPNLKKIFTALQALNACWITNEIDPITNIEKTQPVTESFIRTNQLMMLCTDLGYLDVFSFIPGYPNEPVESLFSSSETYEDLKFVSLEWLLKMKRSANRPRDIEDIANLSI
jgi:hypothetical protein